MFLLSNIDPYQHQNQKTEGPRQTKFTLIRKLLVFWRYFEFLRTTPSDLWSFTTSILGLLCTASFNIFQSFSCSRQVRSFQASGSFDLMFIHDSTFQGKDDNKDNVKHTSIIITVWKLILTNGWFIFYGISSFASMWLCVYNFFFADSVR